MSRIWELIRGQDPKILPQTRRIFLGAFFLLWAALVIAHSWRVSPFFRAWDEVYPGRAPGAPPLGPDDYPRNIRIERESIGDLGYKTWVPSLQVSRHIVFSVDGRRRRNPKTRPEEARVVVIGDSFSVGSGVSDDETISARLAERLGVPVYNDGSPGGDKLRRYLAEELWKKNRPEVVVVVRALRQVIHDGAKPPPSAPTRPPAKAAPVDTAARIAFYKRRLEEDNQLRWGLRLGYGAAHFRLWKKAPYLRRLEGAPVLVFGAKQTQLLGERAGYAERIADRLAKGAAELKARGGELVFVPVPEALTTYPELLTEAERAQLTAPSFLDEFFAACAARGLHCVDLRGVFKSNREPYLYQRDDTHWSARAISLASDFIAPLVQGLMSEREVHKLVMPRETREVPRPLL